MTLSSQKIEPPANLGRFISIGRSTSGGIISGGGSWGGIISGGVLGGIVAVMNDILVLISNLSYKISLTNITITGISTCLKTIQQLDYGIEVKKSICTKGFDYRRIDPGNTFRLPPSTCNSLRFIATLCKIVFTVDLRGFTAVYTAAGAAAKDLLVVGMPLRLLLTSFFSRFRCFVRRIVVSDNFGRNPAPVGILETTSRVFRRLLYFAT